MAGPARRLGAAVTAAAMLAGIALADDAVPEPDGYRLDDYRAPVPASLAGARVVDSAEAHALWQAGEAVFIDVMPRPPRPANLPAGTVWRDQPRDNIPGSAWLANVGYGRLHPTLSAWFADALDRLAGGDRARPLLFYCLADCWMSWNAAKRALEHGYRTVIWYPDGTDGWSFAGYPLARSEPEPLAP